MEAEYMNAVMALCVVGTIALAVIFALGIVIGLAMKATEKPLPSPETKR